MSHRSQMSPRLTLSSAPQQPLTDTDTLAGPASRPQVSSWQSRLAAGELSSQLPHRWEETLSQSGARLWPDDKKPPFPILGSEKADFAKGSKWLKTKGAQAREWSKLRCPEVSLCKKRRILIARETCHTGDKVLSKKKRFYNDQSQPKVNRGRYTTKFSVGVIIWKIGSKFYMWWLMENIYLKIRFLTLIYPTSIL